MCSCQDVWVSMRDLWILTTRARGYENDPADRLTCIRISHPQVSAGGKRLARRLLRSSSQSFPLVSRAIIFRSWPGLHGCSPHSSWQELPSARRMRLAQLHADPRLLRDEDPRMRDLRVGATAPSSRRHWDSSLSQQLLRDVLEMRDTCGTPGLVPTASTQSYFSTIVEAAQVAACNPDEQVPEAWRILRTAVALQKCSRNDCFQPIPTRPKSLQANQNMHPEDFAGFSYKTAFFFPGQGAQTVGMCKELTDEVPKAKEMFETASDIIGYDLLDRCVNGPKEELDKTAVSQPVIFVASMAAVEKLRLEDPAAIDEATVAMGLSLGEYSALSFAGALSKFRTVAWCLNPSEAHYKEEIERATYSKDGALSKEELEKYMATSPGRHQCGMQGLEWLVLFHDLGMILSQCPALSRWEIEEFPQELERVRNLERDRFAQIACVLRSTCRYRLPLSCDVAPCPGRVQEKFKLADADGDGKLQGEETRLAR
eukprot:s792_g3.t3